MLRFAAVLLIAVGLAGCDMIKSATNMFKYAEAAAADLEATTGVKPIVGFNWNNGKLTQVTVTFPRIMEDKPIRELAGLARTAVRKEFSQEPGSIVLSFVVDRPGATKQAAAD
jgi:hypothetical protein